MATNYEALELTIGGSFDDPDGFVAEANYGPSVGSGPLRFTFPYTKGELEKRVNTLKREAQGLRRSGDGSRSAVNVESFGTKLFNAVFQESVRDVLREAQRHGPVRIRLRIDAPELADVPWEYLYDASKGRYLALRSDSPVVRTFTTGSVAPGKLSSTQLNVLVMVAGGGGAGLSTEAEFAQLEAELAGEPNVTVTRVSRPTIGALQEALREPVTPGGALPEYHVFHFIGHGEFDDHREAAALYLEDEAGNPIPVPAEQLTRVLSDHDPLRLVMLNSCEGARASVSDPTAGLAQSLFVGGVQVVIAMQYEITDASALTFSRLLYKGLAEHQPVEQAITEARKPLDGREWATPVVFMRADGRFFADTRSVPEPAEDAAPSAAPEPAPRPEPAAPPAAASAPSASGAALPEAPRSRTPLVVGAVALAAVVGVVGFLLSRGGDDDPGGVDTLAGSDAVGGDTTTSSPPEAEEDPVTDDAEVVDDDPAPLDDGALGIDTPDGFVEPEVAPFENGSAWYDLFQGECIVDDLFDAHGYEGALWEQVVDCSELDVLLVVAMLDLADDTTLAGTDQSTYPGEAVLGRAIGDACDAAFAEDFELQDLGYTTDDVLYREPTVEEWAAGIRRGACVVPY